MADFSADLAVLIEARALVSQGWCQGVEARDDAGNRVRFSSDRAVAWCSIGAVARAAGTQCPARLFAYVPRAIGRIGDDAIEWNDAPGRTQEDVLAAFEAAIVDLRA